MSDRDHNQLELNLRELAQLFNSMDPSPFHERDLDAAAEAFLLDWAREMPPGREFALTIRLGQPPAPEKAAGADEAVRHYFASRALATRRALRRMLRLARWRMFVALLFLGGCLALGRGLESLGLGSPLVDTVGGRAVLETVSGDIEVMSAYDVVDAKAADGDVNARFARIAGPSRLRTDLGNITTIINPEENFSIKARSRWGKIFSEMPVEAARGGTGRSRLVGEYNGGGPELEVEAPGGFVRIKGGEPLFEISD